MTDNVSGSIEEKQNKVRAMLQGSGRVAIAYSGGVDSTLLLKMAIETRGTKQVTAIMALGPMVPESEARAAEAYAWEMGAEPVIFQAAVMGLKEFVENDPRRCYYCKRYLFTEICRIAAGQGCQTVIDGTNADDAKDYRPGRQALAELGIRSPFLEAGLTKEEIRSLSRAYGLETAGKPAMACLATRIPTGTAITEDALKKAEAGEEYLKRYGLKQYRLRVLGDTARIECLKEEIPRVEAGMKELERYLKSIGFGQVQLDPAGYVCGNMNRSVENSKVRDHI